MAEPTAPRPLQVDDLAAALRVRPAGGGNFKTVVPDGWQQGRGAFGGLVLGLLAEAMEAAVADPERPLRTLSGEILAPVLAEEVELRVEVLRRGSGLTSMAARLHQGGEVRAHATALFAKTRLTDRDHLGLAPPARRDWTALEPVPVAPPFGPDFARAFEYRSTGALPFSFATELSCEGFVRTQRPLERLSAPRLVALIDAWWPTAFAREEGPRPMATVSFGFQLLSAPASLPAAEPLRYRARALGAHDGYLFELRELWTADGRLVALNPQTFAYIR